MLDILLKLAMLNASRGISLNTHQLGQVLGCSQQTASRKLVELEKEGLIERKRTFRGQKITLTLKGMDNLREHYIKLRSIFEEKEAVTIKGELVSGMGEGQYYVTRKRYVEQFEEKLGFRPFPGTLNLLLGREHDLIIREMLENCPHIRIEGFTDEDRTFGAVKCYPVSVDGIRGAILSPMRTHHPRNVIEIISPVFLREKLRLKDGDNVFLKVLI